MVGTRKFNEDEVLTLAIDVFWAKGYTATTMLDLAKETGVQRGSLYNAYQNKNTLFLKSFTLYTHGFLQLVETELDQKDAKQAFSQLFNTIIERLTSDTDDKGCFSTRVIMEASQQCPDIHLCLLKFLDRIEALVQQRLEQAIKDQQFSGNALSCARYVVALTRGVAVIERMYNDKARITDIYKTALEQMPFTHNN
jgi:AcrR family transcriptional regulator